MWPLSPAAESCFGTRTWPEETPPPQAWLEVAVESGAALAAAELPAAGPRLLRGVREEPWGQTTTRLLSPEGLRVGVTYTPVLHAPPPRSRPLRKNPPPGRGPREAPNRGAGRGSRRDHPARRVSARWGDARRGRGLPQPGGSGRAAWLYSRLPARFLVDRSEAVRMRGPAEARRIT